MDTLPEIDRLLATLAASTGAAYLPALDAVTEAVVASYRPGLYRLACAMLRDADEAEDAVQQTFLAAVLSLSRYRPGTNFKAWLFTIAVNTCRGALRKRKARQALAHLLGRSIPQPDERNRVEEGLIQDEAGRQLWAAVDSLEEKQRLVLHLRYQQNLSVAEIAEVLSIPDKTVYTRLYDACRKLRLELDRPRPAPCLAADREEGTP